MKIPVLIVHKGYQEYLKNNLKITGKTNKIYLIGDQSLKLLENLPNVTFVDISKYENDDNVKEFKNHFKNYSTINCSFEYLCFARIFFIKLFMMEYNFDKIFHIDSDNILLKDVNSLNFSKDIAYCTCKNFENKFRMAASVHSGLLNLNFCEQFEKLYKEVYITGEKFLLINDKIEWHKKNNKPGGICDMTFYYILEKENYIEVQNLLEKFDNFVFMLNLKSSQGNFSKNQYLMENGILKIFKEGDKSMLYDKIKNEYVETINIHFQGDSKKYLNDELVKRYN